MIYGHHVFSMAGTSPLSLHGQGWVLEGNQNCTSIIAHTAVHPELPWRGSLPGVGEVDGDVAVVHPLQDVLPQPAAVCAQGVAVGQGKAFSETASVPKRT